MNGQGPLDFEATIDAKTFNSIIDEMEKRLKRVSSTAEKSGKSIDDLVNVTVANVKIQKNVIRELEAQLTDLNKKISKLPYGVPAREELRQESIALKRELDAERNALIDLEVAVKNNEVTHESYVKKLRLVRNEMIALEAAGKRNSEEFEKLQSEAGQLAQSINEVYKQTLILSRADRMLQGFVSMIGGLAGGFSAAQGAIGLFSGENENLQKIMVKVQSLMAITIGLQQVQQTLHKDSAFSLVTLVKLKELFALASLKLAGALGISNVAAKALMATLTLGLSIAVTGLILLFDKVITQQNQIRKQQKELAGMVADEAYKTVSRIELLSSKWKALGKDLKEQTKFIKENNDEFESLGTSVRNVAEAENLLIDNKQLFIEAQIEKAKAVAAFALSSEKARELVLNEIELSKTPKQKLQTITDPETGRKLTSFWTENEAYKKLEDEKKQIVKSIEDLNSISIDSQKRAEQILKSAGLSMSSSVVGILANLEKELDDLKSKLKTALTQSEIDELLKLIELKETEISKVLGKVLEPKTKDSMINQLKEIQHAYGLYYKWVEKYGDQAAEKQFNNLLKGGKSYLEYLNNEIYRLESKQSKTSFDLENLGTLLSAKDDLLGAKTRIDLFNEEIQSAKTGYQELIDYINFIKQKMLAVGEFDGSELSFAKIKLLTEELSKSEKEFSKQSMEVYEDLLRRTADFAGKRLDVEKEYQDNVRKLDKNSLSTEDYEKAIAAAKKLKEEQLKAINAQEIASSEAYDQLTNNLSRLSRNEAQRYLEILRKQLALLELQPEEYKKILKLINEIGDGIGSTKIENMADGLGLAADQMHRIADMFSSVNESIDYSIRSLSDAVGYLGNALRGLKTDPTTGGFTDSIGAAGSITGMIFSTADALDKMFGFQAKIKKVEEERLAYNRKLLVTLEDINSELEKQLNSLSSGVNYGQSADFIRETIDQLKSQIDKMKFELQGLPESLGKYVDPVSIGTLKQLTGMADTFEALRKAFKDGIISQEQYNIAMEYYQAIEDAEERLIQIREEWLQSVTGTTADSIIDGIIDGFEQGKFAAEDFADSFEDLMKKAILRAVQTKFLDSQMQEWYEIFAAYSSDGLLSPDEIEKLQEFWYGIINGASDFLEQLEDITGIDFGEFDESASKLTGAIRGVSEETAGIIAGQMNAIRMNQAQALNIMNNQLLELSKIEWNTRNNVYIRNIYEFLQLKSNDVINQTRATGG